MELTNDYRALIDALNAHEIDGFRFKVRGYGHYRDCTLAYMYDEIPLLNKKAVRCIKLHMARNEECLYYGTYNESIKVFHLSGQGKKTLLDIWPMVEVLEIFPKQDV